MLADGSGECYFRINWEAARRNLSTVLQQHMFGCSLKAFSLMAYRLFLFFTFCHILLDIYRYIWYNSYI